MDSESPKEKQGPRWHYCASARLGENGHTHTCKRGKRHRGTHYCRKIDCNYSWES